MALSDGVAIVRFTRQDRKNAFTAEQVRALGQALDELALNDSARVLVITGEGGTFNVGGLRPNRQPTIPSRPWEVSRAAHRSQLRAACEVVRTISRIPKVTIAAINGGCAGAGLALALAADLRYASAGAKFNTGFLAHGNPGELGAIWHSVRLLGRAATVELFALTEKFDADRALELGLVNRVFPDSELLTSVGEIARAIAKFEAGALRAMKANWMDALSASFDEYLERETERLLDLRWSTSDYP
ncbi:2-(1,2-epoxy-1,2-dihydrophenyl)acetyl-CoA isomerase [Mycobacteroides chelonae]|nr:2-(1,2-epoxy-1,2-dihydrophenyl)acetyl-CoA isomerase [Mycobacteroides chelonae]